MTKGVMSFPIQESYWMQERWSPVCFW